MTLTTIDDELAARIEDLTAKVDHLTGLIEGERAGRAAFEELVTDSAPVVRAAYEQAALALQERDIDLSAVTDLLLRLAESAPDLGRALESVESLSALADDAGKLTSQAFELMIKGLAELDRRGYFTFAKGGLDVIDEIVTSFDEDDIKALGDNVVLIFETIKEMTQPEVMQMLQRSFSMMRDAKEPEKLSMFRLLRELRDPEVKLGLHRMLTLLRGLATTPEGTEVTTDEKEDA